VSRVWLFVFAIALHNLPEGMAIGVAFSQGDLAVGLRSPPRSRCRTFPKAWRWPWRLKPRASPQRAVWIAVLSGLMEPVGALLGIGLASGLALAYPVGLASRRRDDLRGEPRGDPGNPPQRPPDAGDARLMAGFAVMMVLDTTLAEASTHAGGSPCRMLPRTGRLRKVRLSNFQLKDSRRFHGIATGNAPAGSNPPAPWPWCRPVVSSK